MRRRKHITLSNLSNQLKFLMSQVLWIVKCCRELELPLHRQVEFETEVRHSFQCSKPSFSDVFPVRSSLLACSHQVLHTASSFVMSSCK